MTNSWLQETEEKLVVVSHYTSALNIIEAYCKKKSYTYHRLDGYVTSILSVESQI